MSVGGDVSGGSAIAGEGGLVIGILPGAGVPLGLRTGARDFAGDECLSRGVDNDAAIVRAGHRYVQIGYLLVLFQRCVPGVFVVRADAFVFAENVDDIFGLVVPKIDA